MARFKEVSCLLALGPTLLVFGCGSKSDEGRDATLSSRFEAIYGYSTCPGELVTTLVQEPIYETIFHIYRNGEFEIRHHVEADSDCVNFASGYNRSGSYEILNKDETNAEFVKVKFMTRRFTSSQKDDIAKQVICNPATGIYTPEDRCFSEFLVDRYLTVRLTAEGIYPPANFNPGASESDINTEVSIKLLKVLNSLD